MITEPLHKNPQTDREKRNALARLKLERMANHSRISLRQIRKDMAQVGYELK